MSISQLTFDHNLGQYVAEVLVGARRVASVMGRCEPTQQEIAATERRLRAMAVNRRQRDN